MPKTINNTTWLLHTALAFYQHICVDKQLQHRWQRSHTYLPTCVSGGFKSISTRQQVRAKSSVADTGISSSLLLLHNIHHSLQSNFLAQLSPSAIAVHALCVPQGITTDGFSLTPDKVGQILQLNCWFVWSSDCLGVLPHFTSFF